MTDPYCNQTVTGYPTHNNLTATTDYHENPCIRTTSRRIYHTAGHYINKIRQIRRDLIKKLEKLESINKLKSSWVPKTPLLISIRIRPSIQLRGVCFGGRGWA